MAPQTRIVMRRRLAVGQHADADPQRLDRVEAARRRQQLRHVGEGLHARRRQALGAPPLRRRRLRRSPPTGAPRRPRSRAWRPAPRSAWPRTISRPASPSTSLITVSATITPSRPLSTRVCSIGIPFAVSAGKVDPQKYIVNLDYIDQYNVMANEWLSSREAARRLGVSAATLYAYVSRGLLRSEAVDGRRERRYRADDIVAPEAAARRRAQGRDRSPTNALDFGTPVLESALTLIEDGRLYYRGRRRRPTGAHRLAGGGRPPAVGLRRQALRADNLPPMTTALRRAWLAAATLGAGRPLPRRAAGRGGARSSELGRGPRRPCSRPACACCACSTAAVTARPLSALPVHEQLASGLEACRPSARRCCAPRWCCRPTTSSTPRPSPPASSPRPAPISTAPTMAGLAALNGPRHGGADAPASPRCSTI